MKQAENKYIFCPDGVIDTLMATKITLQGHKDDLSVLYYEWEISDLPCMV